MVSMLNVGAQTRVNTYTSGAQRQAQVTTLADGTYVITWTSAGEDTGGDGVYMQRYSATGHKLGLETKVNTTVTNDQNASAVAALETGGYVVTWQSNLQDGSGYGIYSQRFDNTGTKVGGEVRVSTASSGNQATPSVTGLNDGGYIVYWNSVQSGSGIYAQRYDQAGVKVGVETHVNTTPYNNYLQDSSITALDTGGYVATWTALNGDSTAENIYYQLFDAAGAKIGGETQVNVTIAESVYNPDVTALNDGGFVVVWTSDGDITTIHSQRYDASGNAQGDEAVLGAAGFTNTETSVTALADGGYVVVWGADTTILLQRFDDQGHAIGGTSLVVPERVGATMLDPDVSALSDGGFVITWTDSNLDGSGSGVFQRAFSNAASQAGDQTLYGTSGNDVLDGGTGADTMIGGNGDDTYYVNWANHDVVYEAFSEGYDTVVSSVTYTLGSDVEALTLTGYAAISGIGNFDDNAITGNAGANVLDGGGGNDTIDGGGGKDTIYGGNGDDDLSGGAGNDTLYGEAGHDDMHGNDGNDTITAGDDGSTITGDAGNDILWGGAGNDNVDGGAGDDNLIGGDGSNILQGADGNDAVYGGNGDDYMTGGTGDDYLQTGNGNDGAHGGDGNDTLIGEGSGPKYLNGDGGDDTIEGGVNNDTITGGSGDDYIYSSAGIDLIDGGSGVDTYYAGQLGGSANINLATGRAGQGAGNVTTLTGFENVTGTFFGDVIVGNTGDNVIIGGQGGDRMSGGGGNDTYWVDNFSDTVIEGANAGYDVVHSYVDFTLGANIEDLVLEGSGNIYGGGNALDNTIYGNSGDNSFNGGGGVDTFYGGAGNDIYFVDNAADFVSEESSGPGTDDGGTDLVYTTVSIMLNPYIENLTVLSFDGNFVLGGNEANNIIIDSTSDSGGAGHNTLYGFGGDDSLQAFSTTDTLYGGAGNDNYFLYGANETASEQMVSGTDDGGTDTIFVGANWTLGAGFENLSLLGVGNFNGTGNGLTNIIIGNSGNNVLDGQAGADTMQGGLGDDFYYVDSQGDVCDESGGGGTDQVYASVSYALVSGIENLNLMGAGNTLGIGNSGNNIIIGNGGANSLTGNDGNDTLNGGAGTDSLTGGLGNDTLTGGTSVDKFIFSAAALNGLDHIADFSLNFDKLVFSHNDYAFAANHVLTASEFTYGTTAVGTSAQFIYDNVSHTLYYDSNGTGAGNMTALAIFDNNVKITTADFLFT